MITVRFTHLTGLKSRMFRNGALPVIERLGQVVDDEDYPRGWLPRVHGDRKFRRFPRTANTSVRSPSRWPSEARTHERWRESFLLCAADWGRQISVSESTRPAPQCSNPLVLSLGIVAVVGISFAFLSPDSTSRMAPTTCCTRGGPGMIRGCEPKAVRRLRSAWAAFRHRFGTAGLGMGAGRLDAIRRRRGGPTLDVAHGCE
jgi:hypothetical protein